MPRHELASLVARLALGTTVHLGFWAEAYL